MTHRAELTSGCPAKSSSIGHPGQDHRPVSPCERDQMSTNVIRMDGKLGQNQPIEPPFAPLVRLPQGLACVRQPPALPKGDCGVFFRIAGLIEPQDRCDWKSSARRDRRLDHAGSQRPLRVRRSRSLGQKRQDQCAGSAAAAPLEISDPLANLRPRVFDALLRPNRTRPAHGTLANAGGPGGILPCPVRDRKPVVSEGRLPVVKAVQPLVPVALGRAIGRLSLFPICPADGTREVRLPRQDEPQQETELEAPPLTGLAPRGHLVQGARCVGPTPQDP